MSNRYAVITLCALALTAGSAPAKAEKLFGAIAFSATTGKVGTGWNYAAKTEASTEAVSQCGADDCDTVVVFPNCGAIAVGDGYGMGFSADKSVAKSEETALSNCTGYTTNCLVIQSLCNQGN
ncbi:MAG: DUF4189 domain-containing protein [Paracoccaceae bacterium]